VKNYKAFFCLMILSLAVPRLLGEDSWLVSTTKKAEAGDVRAQLALAGSLAGTDKDEEAAKWYRRAAEQGDVESMRMFGRYLVSFSGARRKKFPDEEISWFEKAVLKGDGESCYDLYFVYRDRFSKSRYDKTHPVGNGVPDSNPTPTADEKAIFDKALAWLSKGLDMNDPQCMLEYSRLYQKGHVVSEGDRQWLFGNDDGIVTIDEKQAFSFIKKAADVGYGDALYLLGVAYIEGKHVPVDYPEALKLLVRSYRCPSSQRLYGSTDNILGGLFTARQKAMQAKIDISAVLTEAEFAAMLDARFKELEGKLRYYGSTTKDMFESNREAYEDLANFYLSGDPSGRNEKRAFEIYILLSEVCRYDRSIATKLGRIFLEKSPLGFDPRRLVDVLEDIVSQKKKMYTLGMSSLHFKDGEGAEAKEAERDWMTRQESLLLLAKIYVGGRGIDANPGKSNQYYLECLLNEAQQRNLVAAQGGDAQAQFRIGYILLDETESGAQRSISNSSWRGDFFRTPGFIGWSFKQYCDNTYLNTALKLDYVEQREKRKEAIK
jgi:TPR repeat protein